MQADLACDYTALLPCTQTVTARPRTPPERRGGLSSNYLTLEKAERDVVTDDNTLAIVFIGVVIPFVVIVFVLLHRLKRRRKSRSCVGNTTLTRARYAAVRVRRYSRADITKRLTMSLIASQRETAVVIMGSGIATGKT